jgi:hypothetical protein
MNKNKKPFSISEFLGFTDEDILTELKKEYLQIATINKNKLSLKTSNPKTSNLKTEEQIAIN